MGKWENGNPHRRLLGDLVLYELTLRRGRVMIATVDITRPRDHRRYHR